METDFENGLPDRAVASRWLDRQYRSWNGRPHWWSESDIIRAHADGQRAGALEILSQVEDILVHGQSEGLSLDSWIGSVREAITQAW